MTAADVCLISEGAYPYAVGGVSSWVHGLIGSHPELSFQVMVLLPDRTPRAIRYPLPPNVAGLHHVYLDRIGSGNGSARGLGNRLEKLKAPLLALQQPDGGLDDLRRVITALDRLTPDQRTQKGLLDSREGWDLLVEMYREGLPGGPFLDYFWACRCLLGGLFACLMAPLPQARVYHTVSTGYAGLIAARARLETGGRVLLTEHGIYTNERRIEITMADWVYDPHGGRIHAGGHARGLSDVWKDSFASYARACYQASDHILTLYQGNQTLQLKDGAPPDKLAIVPNGIDCEAFASLPPDPEPQHRPTVALIGRVVAIKDVKTYIRACASLCGRIPGLRALVLGPTDEEPDYYRDCVELVHHLGAQDTIGFTGQVNLKEWLGRIDCMALTSISEAQPLTLLEAGAAGVPCVATDVGACREMILGRPDETPPLGPGGAITPPASPAQTAEAIARLLQDEAWRKQCGQAMYRRVRRHYDKAAVDRTYGELYHQLAEAA